MPFKSHDFPVFEKPDEATYAKMLSVMHGYLYNVGNFLHIDPSRIVASMETINEIIERVEKRRTYFHIFHDGCEMGELNEGALLCFWILKLTPFYHPGIANSVLNSKMALCLFINAVNSFARKKNKHVNILPQVINDLYYSFRFRDLSKEALMLLAESLIN